MNVPEARARLLSGWTVVALMCLATLAIWLPDLDLPLGNSDDGRILARNGLAARNFWELGAVESRFGAVIEPFIRAEYGVAPRSEPPAASVTYAHHPPLQTFVTIASVGLLGDNLAALRAVAFCMGAATVAFMAALLRVRGIGWGPTLVALAAMAGTGFFYVYARIGVGYSLLVATTAAVAWLREREHPPRWALAGTAALAALAAMQSWIALATLGLLVPWLLTARRARRRVAGTPLARQAAGTPAAASATGVTGNIAGSGAPAGVSAPAAGPVLSRLRSGGLSAGGDRRAAPASRHRLRAWVSAGWSPALGALVAGAAAGVAVTAAWLLNATDVAELGERTAFRFGSDVSTAIEQRRFTFGEFLARQWRFAGHELMAPIWLRVLLLPALLAGVADRRTRAPMLITLAFAATLTFGFQQGAWIHRLWNFPWLAPVTIGLAALADAARRALRGSAARLRLPAGILAATVAAATLLAVVSGTTRDFYLTDPADAGAVLEQVRSAHDPEVVWTTPGISTPRWVSYYLDAPVFALDESRLGSVHPSDLILVRSDRIPDYIGSEALQAPLATGDAYLVIDAAMIAG